MVSRGDSGWGALTARRSRPLHARQEDTLLCTHSPSTHTRVNRSCINRHTHTHTHTLVYTYIRTCATTHPFFSSGSHSARLRLLHARARTHTTLSSRPPPAPRLSRTFCSSLSLRCSDRRSLAARVRALAVTLCSFVSACTSAESEAPTRTRSRASLRRRLVHPKRQAQPLSLARSRVASMTVRWKIKPR